MARHESDREDLLREATALVERIELKLRSTPHGETITAGFRAGGSASIFFGSDPVYQFNAGGELRRAFCDGRLFKAAGGRLVSLHRLRQQNEVQLLRRDLTDGEQQAFLQRMSKLLGETAQAIERGDFAVVGQVPAEANVLDRVRNWLAGLDASKIASSPHVAPRGAG